MSGQYPGGFNSPVGGHRGQFNPQQQQQQQQMVNINQMVVGGAGGSNMQPNAMSGAQSGSAGGMGALSGNYSQTNMMQQQSNALQQGGVSGLSTVMSSAGMHSPSHAQQQLMQQQQQQLQLQQQMAASGSANISNVGPQMVIPVGAPVTVSHLQQQQQQQQHQQQQHITTQAPVQSQQQIGPPTAVSNLHQQQQHQQPMPAGAASGMPNIPQPNTHKEINIVALSRLGQETVQDITSRFQEIFAALKIIQPSANRDNNTEKKVQEYFRTIRLLFKRVRIIYEKCNDGYPQGMEYTQVESLIPYKDDAEHRPEPTQCEEYRKDLQDNQELIETVKLKNRQLREIIDRTRIIIWEINTMLSMRRS